MQIAVYDMDLTITASPTYTRWLIFWARRRCRWRLSLLPAAALAGIAYRLGLMSRGRLKEIAQSLLMGPTATRADVAKTASAFAATVALRPGALSAITADRAAGVEIVLATASYAFYAAAIAARVGITTVIATESVWRNDILEPRIEGNNCYHVAKAAMVCAHIPDATIVRAYSDHVSDAPLLTLATEAMAVNPSRRLRRLARTRGWRVVDWR